VPTVQMSEVSFTSMNIDSTGSAAQELESFSSLASEFPSRRLKYRDAVPRQVASYNVHKRRQHLFGSAEPEWPGRIPVRQAKGVPISRMLEQYRDPDRTSTARTSASWAGRSLKLDIYNLISIKSTRQIAFTRFTTVTCGKALHNPSSRNTAPRSRRVAGATPRTLRSGVVSKVDYRTRLTFPPCEVQSPLCERNARVAASSWQPPALHFCSR